MLSQGYKPENQAGRLVRKCLICKREIYLILHFFGLKSGGGGSLQLKIRGGWLDSLGSEILVGKDILGFFKNTEGS